MTPCGCDDEAHNVLIGPSIVAFVDIDFVQEESLNNWKVNPWANGPSSVEVTKGVDDNGESGDGPEAEEEPAVNTIANNNNNKKQRREDMMKWERRIEGEEEGGDTQIEMIAIYISADWRKSCTLQKHNNALEKNDWVRVRPTHRSLSPSELIDQ